MRVALYVRVSTSHQVQHQTIEQQLTRLHDYLTAQGWTVSDDHIFRDDGYSGATLVRPGLDRLRDAIHNRAVDQLILTSPDRLARNYVHQMVLLEEFSQSGCQVTFLDRPMSDDPHDHLLLQIRGAVAEYERTLIAERMRRGRLNKLQAGLLLPWTHPPYGYHLHPDRPRDPSGVRVDDAEAAIVAELFASYLEPDMSLAKLAKRLDQRGLPTPFGNQRWSGPTIRGILHNPTYTGRLYAQRTRYRPAKIRRSATHPIGQPHGSATPQPPEQWVFVGTVPAIVTQEQFDLVQAKLAQNKSFARRNNTTYQYLLRALVSCGRCKLACTARTTSHGRYHYYLCNGKLQSVHSRRDDVCPARFTPSAQLDQLVWNDLCEVLTHPHTITAELERVQGDAWLPQELQARRENLQKGQRGLENQQERLTDAYLRGVIGLDEYERPRHDLEQKRQALREQEATLASEAERRRELGKLTHSIEAFCEQVRKGLANATFEQQRQLVLLLIDRVIVTDDKVEIRYVIPTTSASEHVQFCHLRKDYFHHPPARQQHEAAFGVRQFDDLQPHAVRVGVRGRLLARAPLVYERHLDRLTGHGLHLCGQRGDLGAFLWVGRRHDHGQELAQRGDRQMDFAAFAPLVTVVAGPRATFRCRLHGAGIKDYCPWCRRTTIEFPQQHAHIVDQGLEDLGRQPALGLLVDGVPWWQIVRGHVPRCTNAGHPA